MNHLGDTNKMVDTPRTDEAQFGTGRVSVSFARQLERELNAANSKIELLMSANADVARIAGERDKAEKRVLYLESALRRIANQDYRGNRSTESQIAFEALKP